MYKGSPSAQLDNSPHSSIGSNSSGSSGVVTTPNHRPAVLSRQYSDSAQDEQPERVRGGGGPVGGCVREASAPIPIQGPHAVTTAAHLEVLTTYYSCCCG